MSINEIERRSTTTGEVKTEARTLVGYCARYDSPTVIGSGDTAFTEVILKGAFRSCIERGDDIAFLREHSNEMVLARTPKTLKVTEDSAGLRFVATMPRTPLGEETLTLIDNETLRGMSFSFQLGPNDDSWSVEQDSATGKTYVLRKIRNFSRVVDQSVCLWPAYASATVSARAMEARSAVASRAGVISKSEQQRMWKDAALAKLKWIGREIKRADALDDDDDDDDFDASDFTCPHCGAEGELRCARCGEPVPCVNALGVGIRRR